MSATVSRWRLFWLRVRSLPTRARFLSGRASFVEAVVARAAADMTPVVSAEGKPLPPRLLTHHLLAPRPPRLGAGGWRLFSDLLGRAGTRLTRLACPFCGHWFLVGMGPDREAPAAPPASFSADWFRFTPSAYSGPARLDCPRCEQSGAPRVAHLVEP